MTERCRDAQEEDRLEGWQATPYTGDGKPTGSFYGFPKRPEDVEWW